MIPRSAVLNDLVPALSCLRFFKTKEKSRSDPFFVRENQFLDRASDPPCIYSKIKRTSHDGVLFCSCQAFSFDRKSIKSDKTRKWTELVRKCDFAIWSRDMTIPAFTPYFLTVSVDFQSKMSLYKGSSLYFWAEIHQKRQNTKVNRISKEMTFCNLMSWYDDFYIHVIFPYCFRWLSVQNIAIQR